MEGFLWNRKRQIIRVKDQILQELVGMLQQNRQKEEANNVFEMAAYIDSMEKKLDAVTGELVNFKNQLADMERRRERKPLREMISEAAAKIELKCGLLKRQFTEVKIGIREKVGEIVKDARSKGKAALNRIIELFCVRETLLQMKKNVNRMQGDVSHTISKIESFGANMREAGQKIADAFRVITDRPEADYSQRKRKISKTELCARPWKLIRDHLEKIEGRYDKAIEKLDSLANAVEKEKAADNKSVGKNYLETDISPVITAGTRLEFQYGAEAFEAQQLGTEKEKAGSNMSRNIPARVGKSR